MSQLSVDSITGRVSGTAPSLPNGAVVTGVVTATSFSGALTGNVSGNLTGSVTGNVTGNVTGTATTASSLTGTPNITVGAINASSAVISGNVSVAGTITYEDTTNVDSIGVITARSGIHVTGGSIGIGTNNPTSKLQVVGSTDLTKLNLSGISSSISSTATDVFVYDTRKDSDGGAWRKRTQNTSWYNETLNTATRGSRKDFPAVAVIVATTSSVTIYDGDDPDMPMWMVFNSGSGKDKIFNRPQFWSSSAVYALNGIISITNSQSAAESTLTIRYVNDSATLYPVAGYSSYGGVYSFGISGRSNSSGTFRTISQGIVNSPTNDVAMTVLPNAPIDAATGLPVPTIAVATAGGVSVIKDDGSVVDLYRSSGNEFSHNVAFDDNNSLFFSWGTTNGQERHLAYYETIPSSDDTELTDNYYPSANLGSSAFGLNGQGIIANNGRDFAGSDNKEYLVRLYHTKESATSNTSSIAGITTSYNTGWMHGDIKGAFLSDTDDTDVTGSNLIDNGDFGTGDFTNWSTSGTTTPTISSGGALLTTGAIDGAIWQSTSGEATSGKWVITWTVTSNSGGFFGLLLNNDGPNGSGGSLVQDGITTSGSYYYEGSITAVEFRHRGSSSGIIDNINLRRVEDDRSVNNKGLQVFGTITKSAVATGADLVAYSGWSSSNYLQQPYNSDLDFGTGDWCYMFWYNPNDAESGDVIFSRWSYNVDGISSPRLQVYFNNGNLRVDTSDASAGTSYQGHAGSDGTQDSNRWHCGVVLRRGSNLEIWIDGINHLTSALNSNSDGSYTDANAILEIGYSPNAGSAEPGLQLSLLRVSASAPSAEQIKKIYEDEKVLFQENAKCTLYGSSDAVTALAYDDDNQLLHVGTSSGRSDFQGLRRINNTTTAVTTAISASNGLIAEQ